MLRPGVQVLPFGSASGNDALENIHQILHEKLGSPIVEIFRCFLNQDAASRVLGKHKQDPILDA
jgi:hypothetical protein